jgi:hypothetical protein
MERLQPVDGEPDYLTPTLSKGEGERTPQAKLRVCWKKNRERER